jgi:O-antigen/teichoic acid export membrane protein
MRARAFTAIGVVQAFAAPGCAIAFVLATGKGLLAFLWGHAIGQALVFAACIVLLRDIYALQFSMERLRRMLSFSAPLVPAGLALLCAQYVDRVMVKELLSLEHLGLYGVGVRVGSMVAIAVIGLQLTVTPLVYRYAGQPDTAPVVAKLFTLACAGALVLATGLGLFARELVALVSGPGFEGAAAAVYPAALATLAASLYSYAPGLALGNRTGTIALVNVASAALSMALCWLLIPAIGFPGAAVALLIGALVGFGLLARLGRRFLDVPYPWFPMTVLVAGSAALVLQGTGVSSAFRAGLLAIYALATLGILSRLRVLSAARRVGQAE